MLGVRPPNCCCVPRPTPASEGQRGLVSARLTSSAMLESTQSGVRSCERTPRALEGRSHDEDAHQLSAVAHTPLGADGESSPYPGRHPTSVISSDTTPPA